MSKLGIIISNEYRTDISSKSFWISTLVVPVIFFAFSMFGGYMLSESDTAMTMQEGFFAGPDNSEITPLKLVGLLMGMFLTIFIMIYGSQIFAKVKTEKTNRIVEILATSVDGRTMMLAKIISVGLVGLTQILIWAALIAVILTGTFMVFTVDIAWSSLLAWKYIMAVVWGVVYFFGGYVFFGSLFAAVGAMTDKNNENQEYVAILTFLLLISFYIGEYAVDHGSATFVRVCSYIPFTSPTIGAVNAITQTAPVWESLLSVAILYASAWLMLALSGKIYSSSIMLKGKRFSPRDIITFLRTK